MRGWSTPVIAVLSLPFLTTEASGELFQPCDLFGVGSATSVSFAPDNASFVVATKEGMVRQYSTIDGARSRTFSLSSSSYNLTNTLVGELTAFARNGQYVAAAGSEGVLRIWNASDGSLLHLLAGDGQPITALAFSPDSSLVAAATLNDVVWVWNASTGEWLWRLVPSVAGHIRSLAISSDSSFLVSSGGEVDIWSLVDGSRLHTFSFSGPADLAPDDMSLAVVSFQDVAIIRVRDGLEVQRLHVNMTILSLAFSPDGSLVGVSGYGSHRLALWSVENGRLIQDVLDPAPASFAFSSDGSLIATADYDDATRLFRVSDGGLLLTVSGHTSLVESTTFVPGTNEVASSSVDRTIRLWSLASGASLITLQGDNWYNPIAVSPDGTVLASGYLGGEVKIWNTVDGTLIRTLVGHTSWVRAMVFSPDGQVLATGGQDDTVRLWRVSDGSPLRILIGHTSTVRSAAFVGGGVVLATGSSDRTIRLWSVIDGSEINRVTGHFLGVSSVAVTSNGLLLVSGGDDGQIRIWSLPDLAPVRSFVVDARVTSVAFSPDASVVASGTEGAIFGAVPGLVTLWRVSDGEVLDYLFGHLGNVSSVAFSSDGTKLLSGGDAIVRLWCR